MGPDARRAARLLRDAAFDMEQRGAHEKAREFRERAAAAEADADRDLAEYRPVIGGLSWIT